MAISFLDGVANDQSVVGAEHAARRIRRMKLGQRQLSRLNGLFPRGAYIYLIQIENRKNHRTGPTGYNARRNPRRFNKVIPLEEARSIAPAPASTTPKPPPATNTTSVTS